MNELQVFQNPDFGSIRTLTIDDEPWFVGKDVATSLGYAQPSKAVIDHVDCDDKMFRMMSTSDFQNGNLVKTAIINESGLYCLILSSKLPSAKKFKRWVTSEVLPAIRKTGVYALSQSRQRDLTTDDYLKAALIVSRCKNERLPYVVNFLEQAGFCIPEVKSKMVTNRNIPYPDVDIVELLKSYPISELCKRLGLAKSTVCYYRNGTYKPSDERRKFIIETLD